MSPRYLVMCVFGQNNIGFLFPRNHINPQDYLTLSIVTFGVLPRSPPHTRLTWVYLIVDKCEVSSIFQNFYHSIEKQFHTKITILWSDDSREFRNHNLSEFLASKGIVHQNSCAYTPQQKEVVERKNRHVLEVPPFLMLSTSLPSYLWGDAILTATHLINRMSSCILHIQTPLDCLKKSYPSTRLIFEVPLRVFACTADVYNFGHNQTKFTPQAQECVFVGYPFISAVINVFTQRPGNTLSL